MVEGIVPAKLISSYNPRYLESMSMNSLFPLNASKTVGVPMHRNFPISSLSVASVRYLIISFEKKYWASFLFSDFALKNREGNLAFALENSVSEWLSCSSLVTSTTTSQLPQNIPLSSVPDQNLFIP